MSTLSTKRDPAALAEPNEPPLPVHALPQGALHDVMLRASVATLLHGRGRGEASPCGARRRPVARVRGLRV